MCGEISPTSPRIGHLLFPTQKGYYKSLFFCSCISCVESNCFILVFGFVLAVLVFLVFQVQNEKRPLSLKMGAESPDFVFYSHS